MAKQPSMPDQMYLFDTAAGGQTTKKQPANRPSSPLRWKALPNACARCDSAYKREREHGHEEKLSEISDEQKEAINVVLQCSDVVRARELLHDFDTLSPPILARKVRHLLPDEKIAAIRLLQMHDDLLIELTRVTDSQRANDILHVTLNLPVRSASDAGLKIQDLIDAARGHSGSLSKSDENILRQRSESFYRSYDLGKENIRSVLAEYVNVDHQRDTQTFAKFLEIRNRTGSPE